MWEKILKADDVRFAGEDRPRGVTDSNNKTVINLTGLKGIEEFLRIDTHEAIHAASQEEIDKELYKYIDENTEGLLDESNFNTTPRGTMINTMFIRDFIYNHGEQIGNYLAFHEIAAFGMTNAGEAKGLWHIYSDLTGKYRENFEVQAEKIWAYGIARKLRQGAVKVAGTDDRPFGKRLHQIKKFRKEFARDISFKAKNSLIKVLEKLEDNPKWQNVLQDSLDSQDKETIQEVRNKRVTKMWQGVIKAPIFSREESAYLPVDERFDKYLKDFIGPNGRYQEGADPTKFSWQSDDGNARATWSFAENTILSPQGMKRWIGWSIYIFEVAKEHRGQGKAENYLRELVEEIRELERQTKIPEELPIVARQVSAQDVIPFWDKMVERNVIKTWMPY